MTKNCAKCDEKDADVLARWIGDDGTTQWLPTCDDCVSRAGYCEAGDHYDHADAIMGQQRLYAPEWTWAFCDLHEQDALRQIAEHALGRGMSPDEAGRVLSDATSYGPEPAAVVREQLLQATPQESYSLSVLPVGVYDRSFLALRALPNQDRSPLVEEAFARALNMRDNEMAAYLSAGTSRAVEDPRGDER
jgi:hypothetical protein